MQQLWTPWRMEYISSDKPSGCIFCSARARSDDHEALIVQRGARAFVILNKYPYNNGHLMVVPNAHSANLSELNTETQTELMQLIARAIEWLKIASQPQGFNVGMNLGKAGGAGVEDHLHFHVVPRWSGDTNYLSVLGETRTIPQMMDDTWTRLRQVIKQEQSS